MFHEIPKNKTKMNSQVHTKLHSAKIPQNMWDQMKNYTVATTSSFLGTLGSADPNRLQS
jgi:hypothetical protein